jgi:hypothetical protein
MMKQLTVCLASLAVLWAGSGCGDDGDNGDPVITGLLVDRDAVSTEGRATATVEASDPDGDELEYAWTASVGTLSASEGTASVVWTAPTERGTATITVVVDDGHGGTAEQAVEVDIMAWLAAAGSVSSDVPFNSVAFIDADEGWAVGGDEVAGDVPYIYHYTAGAWTDETEGTSGHLHSVVAIADNNVWATGGGGLTYHFDGSAWTSFTMTGGCVHGMTFVDANDGWVTPAHGQPYMRHYTGGAITDWQEVAAPTSSGINAVSMASATSGWAVGAGGAMFTYDGSAWTTHDSPTAYDLNAVHMLAEDEGWCVGAAGKAYRYDGAAWTEVATSVTARLYGLFALDSDNVWAVGAGGTIIFFDGESWSDVASPASADLHAIQMTGDGDGWVVGHDSTVLHFE